MTDVLKCDGCGADVVVSVVGPILPIIVYCKGCTKLNAARTIWAHQRSATYNKVKGGPMAYSRRGGGMGSAPRNYHSTTQQTPQCSFTWDIPRSAYGVKCEYQPNFIEFIKAKIPASDRVWDPTSKTWYIKEAWFDVMHELAAQLWPNAVTVVTRADAELAWKQQEDARNAMLKAQREAVLGPFETALLEFCMICDVDALRKARNAMAITLHPDKGGDANKMAKLNALWYVVESELKKQK
jgi:hypothetical protein